MILAADHFGPDILLISCVVFHRSPPIVPKIVQYVQQRLSLNGSDDGQKLDSLKNCKNPLKFHDFSGFLERVPTFEPAA